MPVKSSGIVSWLKALNFFGESQQPRLDLRLKLARGQLFVAVHNNVDRRTCGGQLPGKLAAFKVERNLRELRPLHAQDSVEIVAIVLYSDSQQMWRVPRLFPARDVPSSTRKQRWILAGAALRGLRSAFLPASSVSSTFASYVWLETLFQFSTPEQNQPSTHWKMQASPHECVFHFRHFHRLRRDRQSPPGQSEESKPEGSREDAQ